MTKIPRRWFTYAALAILVFFLLTEHRAHFLGVLPYLILLACPLMHLFGHHGHSRSHSSHSSSQTEESSNTGAKHES
jgi:hypothetical protein